MSTTAAEREQLFWRLAESLYADPAVTRSTMMGYPCLRAGGKFFACVDRRTGNLVVKVPADRVDELIDDGVGLPFAPNGKVFREWVAIPIPDDQQWSELLDEAKAFAAG
jgi:YjbR